MGTMTVEQVRRTRRTPGAKTGLTRSSFVFQIYRDRKTFSKRVFEVASLDLAGMGFIIISYTLRDIKDDVGYLEVRLCRDPEAERDPPH
jgi:flotillin